MHVRERALAASVAIVVTSHEHSSAARFLRAFFSQTGHLARTVHLVKLQCRQLNRLVLVGNLLGGSVHFLLALLATTSQSQHQVQSRFLLNIVIGQRSAVFQLLSGKNQTLLIRGNALLVLDLRLNVFDGVGWLHVQRDCLTREGLNKDLKGETRS